MRAKPDWETADGRVRLYRGDCLEVLPTLTGVDADCVVTSPPYNTLALKGEPSGMWGQTHGAKGFVERFKANGYADDRPESDYQGEQNRIFSMVADACGPMASLFYNHKLRWRDGQCSHPVQWFRPDGWTLRQEIIWDRGGGIMLNAKMFCLFDERIVWFDKGKHKWNQPSTAYGTIWKITQMDHGRGDKKHPVQFPDELPKRCIEATTGRNDLVLDPFAGSATTGVACIRTGRRFIGIEKDARYFDIAVRRIEKELAAFALFEPPPEIITPQALFGEGPA